MGTKNTVNIKEVKEQIRRAVVTTNIQTKFLCDEIQELRDELGEVMTAVYGIRVALKDVSEGRSSSETGIADIERLMSRLTNIKSTQEGGR